MAQEPYQLMNGPFAVYIADIADPVELPPDIDKAPAGNWALLGLGGDKDITEEGISVNMDQVIAWFRGLGSTAPRKGFRTSEDLIVTFTLADASVENFARAFNDATIDLSGNQRRIELLQGSEVAQFSLLIYGDGKSAYGDFNSFWWLPRCSHDAPLEAKIVKGEPIGLQYRWHVLDDDDYGIGRFDMGDEAGT